MADVNVEIVRAGPDRHASQLQVVPLLTARQQHLTDGNTIPVER